MEILKENGIYSLTRILAVINYLLFVVGTLYLIYTGKTWGNYEVFCVMTAGGGAVTQLSNKWINSKYNTPQGEVGKNLRGDRCV